MQNRTRYPIPTMHALPFGRKSSRCHVHHDLLYDITTAGATRSDIEVLFISFWKFLEHFVPCLAGQQLWYGPSAGANLVKTFYQTLRQT